MNLCRVFCCSSGISFDSSVAGIFWTLAQGGTLVVPGEDEFGDPVALARLARQHRISHLLCIPQLYRELIGFDSAAFGSLKAAIVAGESCPPDVLSLHGRKLPNTELYNEYGPTEATVWCTVHKCDPHDALPRVPIGQAIPGATTHVVDHHLLPVPTGVAGELLVGGPGVALGYLGDSTSTMERFVRYSVTGQRVYRTGDRVRRRNDGTLEFLGRIDHQLKINGYRVEPEEIESTIATFSGVSDSVVVAARERVLHNHVRGRPSHRPSPTNVPGHRPSTEELLGKLKRLDKGVAEQLLRSVESGESDNIYKMQREKFEVELRLHSDSVIKPPRKSQRGWLVNQLLNEVADDLEHLDQVASRFVPGKERTVDDFRDFSGDEVVLDDQQIIEDWQTPLMRAMAGLVTQSHGDVLEIGFGRGVSATFIQQMGVRSHTIIESNAPCVQRHFVPWREKHADREIRLIHSRWQDALDHLGKFDGVFFHAFPMNEHEFMEHIVNSVTYAEHFFETAASLLSDGGVFTYLSTEIDSVSRRHQRKLFRWFRQVTTTVASDSRFPPRRVMRGGPIRWW